MIEKSHLSAETYAKLDELIRLGSIAVSEAQDDSRRQGVPNVYSINGRIYYETPTGELSATDPYPIGTNATKKGDDRGGGGITS